MANTPYEYSVDGIVWQSSNIIANVQGVITPLVRDAEGNIVAGDAVSVQVPAAVAATSVVVNTVNVEITATGGVPPYQYTLPMGMTNNTGVFNNLANGNYVVTVTDFNGCTTTTSFAISYTAMTAVVTTTGVSCNGGSDGAYNVTVNGGVSPYTYNPGNSAGNLTAGQYVVVVTDATGNTVSVTASVTQPPVLNLTATPNGNGTVTLAATGGTAPYTYSEDGVNYQSSNLFTDVLDGTYSFAVRDAKGCIKEVTVTVVGTQETAQAWGLQVMPNPSTGLFRVTMGDLPSGELRISVVDVLGRKLQEQNTRAAGGAFTTQVDLRALPAGLYALQFTHEGRHTAVWVEVAR
jgi:large repetitive protein